MLCPANILGYLRAASLDLAGQPQKRQRLAAATAIACETRAFSSGASRLGDYRSRTISDKNHVRRSVWSIQTSIKLAVATSLYFSHTSCVARKERVRC